MLALEDREDDRGGTRGGTIDVTITEGAGTALRIELPLERSLEQVGV